MLLDVRREEVMNMEINLQQGNTIVTVIGQENLGEDMLGQINADKRRLGEKEP